MQTLRVRAALDSTKWRSRRLVLMLRSRSRPVRYDCYWTPALTLCVCIYVAWVMTTGLRRLLLSDFR